MALRLYLQVVLVFIGYASAAALNKRQSQTVNIGSYDPSTFCGQFRDACVDYAEQTCHHHEDDCSVNGNMATVSAVMVPFINNPAGSCNIQYGPASGPQTPITENCLQNLGLANGGSGNNYNPPAPAPANNNWNPPAPAPAPAWNQNTWTQQNQNTWTQQNQNTWTQATDTWTANTWQQNTWTQQANSWTTQPTTTWNSPLAAPVVPPTVSPTTTAIPALPTSASSPASTPQSGSAKNAAFSLLGAMLMVVHLL